MNDSNLYVTPKATWYADISHNTIRSRLAMSHKWMQKMPFSIFDHAIFLALFCWVHLIASVHWYRVFKGIVSQWLMRERKTRKKTPLTDTLFHIFAHSDWQHSCVTGIIGANNGLQMNLNSLRKKNIQGKHTTKTSKMSNKMKIWLELMTEKDAFRFSIRRVFGQPRLLLTISGNICGALEYRFSRAFI